MKTMKRLATVSAATILAVSMVAATSSFAAFAETATTTINVSTDDPHTYKYYQIFTGDQWSDGLLLDENLAFGSGVNESALKTALSLTEDATAADVAHKLDNMSAAEMATLLKTEGVLKGEGTTLSAGETNVAQGYYYIVEFDGTETGDILKLGNEDINVTPKFGKPTAEKKIQEDDRTVSTGSNIKDYTYDTGWNDAADYSIGEMVPFKVTGTLPANIGSFEHYYYKFTDKLGAGFVAPKSTDVEIAIDGTVVGKGVVLNISGDNATVITVTFDDILNVEDMSGNKIDVTANSKVTISYSAKLDTDAVIGNKGNTNGVDLTYTEDTEYDGKGTPSETTTTVPDGVVAFTYTLDTTKVDSENTTQTLKGAKFKLLNAEGTKAAIIEDGKFKDWAEDTNGGTEMTTPDDGKFTVIGLDSGTYKLREIEAPTGYNKLTEDITVVVSVDMNSDGTWDYVENDGSSAFKSDAFSVKYDTKAGTADAATGVLAGQISNAKGVKLPETGGIGTKLFYVGGGALVLASGVLLVTKRRMKNQAE